MSQLNVVSQSLLMDDEISIETQVMNNLSSNKPRTIIAKLAPPLFCFMAGMAVFYREANGIPAMGTILRTRQLYVPYNTSTTVNLPEWTKSFADVWEPMLESDTPFFWEIPKAGGSTITKVWSYCLGLVLASDQGIETNNVDLAVYSVDSPVAPFPHVPRYVNVKTQNEYWINKCKERGLLESGLADAFVSPHLSYAGANLFEGGHKARGLVMMRHPVKRMIDHYFYRQSIHNGANIDTQIPTLSLEEYVDSDQMLENFEVRLLNGITDSTAEITEEHLVIAKEILRRKFIVGIFEWFDVGMVRFEKYFGWWDKYNVMNDMAVNNCHFSLIEGRDYLTNFPKVEKNAEKIYTTIMRRNWADIELYQYAKALFAEQAKLI